MDIFITIVITSLVWVVITFNVLKYVAKKNLYEMYGIPTDFSDRDNYADEAIAVKEYLCRTKEFKKLFFFSFDYIMPYYCRRYYDRTSEHNGLKEFIMTVKLLGRDIAFLNKDGDIELIV